MRFLRAAFRDLAMFYMVSLSEEDMFCFLWTQKNCCLLCAFSLHLPLKLLHDLPPSSPHPFPSLSPSSPSFPSQSPLMKAGGQESTSLRQIFQASRWGKLFKDKICMYSDIARVTLNYSYKSFMTLTVSTTAINHPWLCQFFLASPGTWTPPWSPSLPWQASSSPWQTTCGPS